MPLPAVPALMVIHVAALVAVHAQPAAAVTTTLPVIPAATTFADAVEIAGAHGVPNCVTVNVDPAIVSVPVRLAEPRFGATLNVTAPDPEPDDPAVIVIHAALLIAAHRQPAPTVTVLLPAPAAAAIDWDVGEMEGAHGVPNAKVLDRELSALPPGPTAETIASYITPGVRAVVSRGAKSRRTMPSAPGAGFPRLADDTTVVPPAMYTNIA